VEQDDIAGSHVDGRVRLDPVEVLGRDIGLRLELAHVKQTAVP
jgi:hypothetical protein